MPTTVADRPQVFATFTAPSFGSVHTTTTRGDTQRRICRDHHRMGGQRRCPHGKPLWCNATHDRNNQQTGQPLCTECYDYVGHVLFTWHMPELWRRFTITLRRALRRQLRAAGVDADVVRVSFIKVVELQARAIPHIHALIRLDPHEENSNPDQYVWQSPISAPELATIIQNTARAVTLTVEQDDAPAIIRFGAQIDTQPITTQPELTNQAAAQHDFSGDRGIPGRRVARYLAKYVTKSLTDLGISARRLSAEAIPDLDVSDHVRAILTAISQLANNGLSSIGRWLHTLGYRGHITSKSRRYSTTMTALRERRNAWTREKESENTAHQHDQSPQTVDADDPVAWEFDRSGHTTMGDRTLTITAALHRIQQRHTAREALRQQRCDTPIKVPDG
jgi:replication initiator protein RepSA